MELAGKRVLITGGAVRVGAALAEGFARSGARITIHYRRSAAEAERLLCALPGEGHDAVSGDLADPAAAESLLSRLDHPVDILVNNASYYVREEAEAALCRQVNVLSPVALMEAFAAMPGGSGRAILNLLDGAALREKPDMDPYTASRVELARLTREWARRLAPEIRVNGLAPGPVLPPVWLPESRMANISLKLPLQHPVDLQELVEAALLLCRADSLTGVLLPVDCGLHLT